MDYALSYKTPEDWPLCKGQLSKNRGPCAFRGKDNGFCKWHGGKSDEIYLAWRVEWEKTLKRAWHKANPEASAAISQRKYLKRKEAHLATAAIWKLANPLKVKAYSLKASAKRRANLDFYNKRQRELRKENLIRYRQVQKAWRDGHRDEQNAKARARLAAQGDYTRKRRRMSNYYKWYGEYASVHVTAKELLKLFKKGELNEEAYNQASAYINQFERDFMEYTARRKAREHDTAES